jgi:glutathione S-transferase
MSLTYHYHPLSSFCHKSLIALYEHGVEFTPLLVDLGNEASRSAFLKVWPLGKFPVLQDTTRSEIVPESSIIIEYLDQYYAGASKLIPGDADRARKVRLHDRFFDHYIHIPMQAIVGDRIRPADKKDPFGVEQARARMTTALDMVEQDIPANDWLVGTNFTLADCSAAPALFYAHKVLPFDATHPNTFAYLNRLMRRPSYARVLKEAEPYFWMFPK